MLGIVFVKEKFLKQLIKTVPNGVQLQEVIIIDEYEADTDAARHQVIIANRFRYCRSIH